MCYRLVSWVLWNLTSLQLWYPIEMQSKTFLTWWPWSLTYDLYLQTWSWYPSTWHPCQSFGLYERLVRPGEWDGKSVSLMNLSSIIGSSAEMLNWNAQPKCLSRSGVNKSVLRDGLSVELPIILLTCTLQAWMIIYLQLTEAIPYDDSVLSRHPIIFNK